MDPQDQAGQGRITSITELIELDSVDQLAGSCWSGFPIAPDE